MRILVLLLTLVLTSTVQAQGFLDAIRKRVTETVDNAVDEVRSVTNQEIGEVNQDVSQSTDGLVEDVLPQVPNAGLPSSSTSVMTPVTSESTGLSQGVLPDPLFWGTPSGNTLKAIDQEIQGMRLGMPEMYVDEILRERGYERNRLNNYSKQQMTADGQLIRTQRIRYLTVEPSQEFINELDEGELREMIRTAQRQVDENQQAAATASRSRDPRSRETRSRSTSSSNGPRDLQLVYLISYEQIYNQQVRQFDLNAMMGQVRAAFGPSTFPDDQLRSGMAFNKPPETTLIYHDASLLSVDYRDSLVKSVPGIKLGHMEAVYNALRVPCGGPENPWGAPGGGGCLPGWSDAYPDFDRQMELNRAVLSPYMRIGPARSGAGVETRLEWSYLQSERGIRERNATQAARDNAPPAELDF